MARPQRNNADYFSHDANFRNDPKVRAVRNKFGFTGYGVVCMMHEILAYTDNFVVEWDELSQEIFAGDIGLEVAEMQDVIAFCVKIQLFTLENDQLFSVRLTESLRSLVEKRRFMREKYDASEVSDAETTNDLTLSDAESPQSKAKHSIEKKRRKEGEGAAALGTQQDFSERIVSEAEAQEINRITASLRDAGVPSKFVLAAYLHYAAKDWMLSENVRVRDRVKTIFGAWQSKRKRKAIQWQEAMDTHQTDMVQPPKHSTKPHLSDNYDEEIATWAKKGTQGLMSGFVPLC